MNLCCTCDDNYVLPLRVMLESLSRYDKDIEFYLVYSDVNEVNLGALASDAQSYGWSFHAVKIDDDVLRLCDSLPKIQYFSKEVYYRLLIPWILCECDKVLYMDCDTLVRGSLAGLYATEMDGALIAAVPDNKAAIENRNKARLGLDGRYYNSGVLLIDCKAIRGEVAFQAQMISLITDAVAGNSIVYPDQDLINLIYRGKIKTLDTNWNFQTLLKNDIEMIVLGSESRQVKVMHYVRGIKPWHAEYDRWLVFEYWAHLKKFITEDERHAYWKRKKFVRSQFRRVVKKLERLCSRSAANR